MKIRKGDEEDLCHRKANSHILKNKVSASIAYHQFMDKALSIH